MTGLSLFSGVGGMDLGFEAAGGSIAAMCEIDTYCREVLLKHWPNIPIHEDIKALRGDRIGTVDVIYGGFPCQPFSVAGNQKGQNDDRYLWPEFSRLVGEVRPLWVVAENVPGIINLSADEICADLERKGYEVGIWNFEAAAVGALHRRARIFFVGYSERSGLSRLYGRWTRKEPADGCANITGFYSPRQLQHCNGGELESELGGVADGLPSWLDGSWWRYEPDIPRVSCGILNRMQRLKALGNAVVPAQVYPIFKAIIQGKL